MNSRSLARLKEQLRPRVSELNLGDGDLASFRKYLEDFRARPVYLVPRPLGPEILGLWVATDSADYIFYEQATTPYHQRHIVFHEGSHMLQGHQGSTLPDVVSTLTPHLDPQLVRSLLCRSVFDTDEEAEAEVLATLIEEHMEQPSPPSLGSVSPKTTRDITEFFLRNR